MPSKKRKPTAANRREAQSEVGMELSNCYRCGKQVCECNCRLKLYVASSWRNEFQPSVVKLLREEGFAVYDFRRPKFGDCGFHWRQIDPEWQQWSVAAFRRGLRHPMAAAGCHQDFAGMKWADACVLVLPCGRSAHLEAGWFLGRDKPLIVFIPGNPEPELMYRLAGSERIVGDTDQLVLVAHHVAQEVLL